MDPSHQWKSTLIWSLGRSEVTMVLTTDNFVQQVRRRELAPLEIGRWEHACASYTVGDNMVSDHLGHSSPFFCKSR